ncbi:MAG: hypothetical protein AB7F59_15260 [Bdellovibrionales bacterium]
MASRADLKPKNLSQLELEIQRSQEPDRNHQKGGRSFYFFDFDDNVAFLSTKIYLFHQDSGEQIAVSTADYAQNGKLVGKQGLFKDYNIRLCDETGSFRRFRDFDPRKMEAVLRSAQPFVEDLMEALGRPDLQWKGPSWSCFYHAAFNQRPISVITARGHHPETIRLGIESFVQQGHLPVSPNYLGIYPVSHRETRQKLGDHEEKMSVAQLKRKAIRQSVEQAFEIYGFNEHHRFGMSDDDPHNVELIIEEMVQLKKDYPTMSFFVIEAFGDRHTKIEILEDHLNRQPLLSKESQLSFF